MKLELGVYPNQDIELQRDINKCTWIDEIKLISPLITHDKATLAHVMQQATGGHVPHTLMLAMIAMAARCITQKSLPLTLLAECDSKEKKCQSY